MIDASTSMNVEDIRPNRFERAINLSRHFVKRSAGHLISIVLFSDIHKRIIPFTDDIDLLDSRLEGLKNNSKRSGASNISQSLQEVLKYFNEDRGEKKIHGNILLITDSEENGNIFNIEKNLEVNLAVLAVGTKIGGKVPMKTKRGNFIGYKKFKGKYVISKINEDGLKKIGENFKSFNFWIVESYAFPTKEVLSFFRENFYKSIQKRSHSQRPVLANYLLILSIIFFVFSAILSRKKTFVAMFAFLFFSPNFVKSKESKLDEKIENFKKKGMGINEKADLGTKFLQNKKIEEGQTIYKEVLSSNEEIKRKREVIINLGTSYLLLKKEERHLIFLEIL